MSSNAFQSVFSLVHPDKDKASLCAYITAMLNLKLQFSSIYSSAFLVSDQPRNWNIPLTILQRRSEILLRLRHEY